MKFIRPFLMSLRLRNPPSATARTAAGLGSCSLLIGGRFVQPQSLWGRDEWRSPASFVASFRSSAGIPLAGAGFSGWVILGSNELASRVAELGPPWSIASAARCLCVGIALASWTQEDPMGQDSVYVC